MWSRERLEEGCPLLQSRGSSEHDGWQKEVLSTGKGSGLCRRLWAYQQPVLWDSSGELRLPMAGALLTGIRAPSPDQSHRHNGKIPAGEQPLGLSHPVRVIHCSPWDWWLMEFFMGALRPCYGFLTSGPLRVPYECELPTVHSLLCWRRGHGSRSSVHLLTFILSLAPILKSRL